MSEAYSLIVVYVDEAGDLGFKSKSSKYFAVGYIMLQSSSRISGDVKRLLKNTNRHKGAHLTEFKFRLDNDLIKCIFLNAICKYNFCGGQVLIEKEAVQPHLRDKPPILYNYVVVDTIWKAIFSEYGIDIDHVNLYLDLSMSKNMRDEFNKYFSLKLVELSYENKIINKITHNVFHVHSHHEPCIQVVDYIASSIFKAYEHNNSKYYEMVRDKIKYKLSWSK